MNLNSFIKYLAVLRWSKVLAYFFALICFLAITSYFYKLQKNHRKTKWEFVNVSNVYSGSMKLEPGRIYKVSWEQEEGTPTEVYLDGQPLYTLNYFQLPYNSSVINTYSHVNTYITNPMKIRVNKPTDFGLVFQINTTFTFQEKPGEFFKKWFKHWVDPVAEVDWMVEDITDEGYQGRLLVDGSFNVIYHKY